MRLLSPRFTVVLLIVVLLAYGNWVSGAPNNRVREVDAVVVHAGGEGERLDRALEIMDGGFADTLVVMRGDVPDWPEGNALCASGGDGYDVICPTPDPDTTIGEAQALSILVNQRGWETVIAVTSDYHLRRALHIDRACSPDLTVYAAGAEAEMNVFVRTQRVVWEMAGMPQALFAC